MSEIYLAGGCFWGVQKYMKSINGVLKTEVGYANGNTLNPTYEQVCHFNTGHAETVKVVYDENKVPLTLLLDSFYKAINPTTKNKQGNDMGIQYRTGIYYTSENELQIIQKSIKKLQEKYTLPIVIEVLPLSNYSTAEEYHQNYLDKNPNGYCHIGKDLFEKA